MFNNKEQTNKQISISFPDFLTTMSENDENDIIRGEQFKKENPELAELF